MAQYRLVLDDTLKSDLEKEAKHCRRSLNGHLNYILEHREPVHIQTDEEREAALKTQGDFEK